MLWKDLKQGINKRKPTNMTESKRFCTEEWAKLLQAVLQDWSAVELLEK